MTPKQEISPSQIDSKISEFEKRLDRLYRMYEQYFIGVEQRPPRNERRQVVRLYRELEQLPKLKTSLKFRFRSMVQRFNSYKSYWDRTERQIEEGTYHRDVARAKARKRRQDAKEKQQPEASGRADDGAIEIDDLDLEKVDLASLEDELQQMEERGEFEKYVGTAKMKRGEFPEDAHSEPRKPANEQPAKERPAAQSGGWERPKVDEDVKQKRLAELQAKLGLSNRGTGGDAASPPAPGGGNNPFERSAEGPTQKARPENPSAPSRGADISKLRQLRRAKERIEREQKEGRTVSRDRNKPARGSNTDRGKRGSGSNRVIRRDTGSSQHAGSSKKGGFSDEHSRKIYNSLVEAKRRCNEDTSGLNYNSFKKTMDRQRTQIQKKKGARNVDFKVVIKDGRAFLKPETKK
ncbi:MAG: MXAN_5187 C-terminal domain-containing protein [Persicimonas sp.]